MPRTTPISTEYNERSQDPDKCKSAYGSHWELDWCSSLRSPRNPVGFGGKEMTYKHQMSPVSPGRNPVSMSADKIGVNLTYHKASAAINRGAAAKA